MIPGEKIEAVTRGLRETFGVTEADEISRVTGGHTSSLVFRIVVRGSPYLLKVIIRAEDPSRHYASMRAAAGAGVAPRVLYANIEDKISITDFVLARPLPESEALARLPALLRTLHALPPFGRAPFNTTCTFLFDGGPALDGFFQQFKAANLLPRAEDEELFAAYARLAAVYPHDDGALVSSHNDLFKPDNILFDGQRVWLVDWEAAFLNDKYADLAVVANQLVTYDEEELVFLRRYFGAEPDQYRRARFHLMRQVAHLFYAMVFLFQGSSGESIDWRRAVPDYGEFHRRMWTGKVDLSERDTKVVYGRVHWERFLRNVRQPRYEEALRIVSNQHPTA